MVTHTYPHCHAYAGRGFNDCGFRYYGTQYGRLSTVTAETACNYSYREFWF
jgi:hypothetical protein